jgi:hypothetical protein
LAYIWERKYAPDSNLTSGTKSGGRSQLDDHMKSSLFAALLGFKGLLTKEPEIKFMNED